jgi:hypothetical protein
MSWYCKDCSEEMSEEHLNCLMCDRDRVLCEVECECDLTNVASGIKSISFIPYQDQPRELSENDKNWRNVFETARVIIFNAETGKAFYCDTGEPYEQNTPKPIK